MTDLELLQDAAKAAGATFCNLLSHGKWNPLIDDGDALRLAVALGLRVSCERTTTTVYTPTSNRYCWNEAAIVEGDPYAATRRAIVRAAAAMAEDKP